jgi:hypothetical protein
LFLLELLEEDTEFVDLNDDFCDEKSYISALVSAGNYIVGVTSSVFQEGNFQLSVECVPGTGIGTEVDAVLSFVHILWSIPPCMVVVGRGVSNVEKIWSVAVSVCVSQHCHQYINT